MELILLGSSAAIPVRERNLPGIALRYKNEIILFDCGEDIQRRFVEASLKFNKSLVILISHFHGDHVIGLPGLLFRFGLSDRTAPVVIIGPRNLFLYLYLHRKILGLKTNYPLKIFEINHLTNKVFEFQGLNSEVPTAEKVLIDNCVFKSELYDIRYTLVDHSVVTYAYAFEEHPRPGKFNPERAREIGIPESRLWKKLHNGKTVEINGKVVDPEKEGIVGPKRDGRKITYSGDTGPSEALIELGKDSDVLIHESTFSKQLEEIAREKKHSTTVDAAKAALKMNAKQLILTHISSRYQGNPEGLLEEAKAIFPNTLIGEDLMRINIT